MGSSSPSGLAGVAGLAVLAMTAFAANSLLARLALVETEIDPASFSAIRLTSGAIFLAFVAYFRRRKLPSQEGGMRQGSWPSALALFFYAVAFSYAYVQLHTGTGALILFGAVQVSMLIYGFSTGSRFNTTQWVGFIIACCAVIYLLSPGAVAPDLPSAGLMVLAGVSWAVYTLRGRGGDPTLMSAGNFMRTVPLCLVLCLVVMPQLNYDSSGGLYALLSGVVTSGLGYVIWYRVVPQISVVNAATIQLSVPLIAAGMGVLFVSEQVTLQLAIAAVGIVLGIGVVLRCASPVSPPKNH